MEKKILFGNLKGFSTYLLLAIGALFILGTVESCLRTAAINSVPKTALELSLDSLCNTIFDEKGPGGIIIVSNADSTIYNHAQGLAVISNATPITDSTIFNVSSTSKSFSAAGVLLLEEQGLLNIDQSIDSIFPEFEGDFFKEIKLWNVLTHSSGLPDIRPRDPKEWSKYLSTSKSLFSSVEDYRLFGMEDEHMKIFSHLNGLEYKPGSEFNLNDPAFILVTPLIERTTLENYDAWMQKNIFDPADIHDAFYYTPGRPMPKAAHAYRAPIPGEKSKAYRTSDGKWEEYDYGEVPFFLNKANRGLFISPKSLVKWQRALFSGKILNDSSLHKMCLPLLPTSTPNAFFGLGVAVRQMPGYPQMVYHINSNGAFAAVDCSIPEKNVHFIILANRDDWDKRSVTEEVMRLLKENGLFD